MLPYIDYAADARQREEWRAWLQARAEERRQADDNDRKVKP